jgi:G3E family GTPase
MQKKGKFDYILLETTGLADPGPIGKLILEIPFYTGNHH